MLLNVGGKARVVGCEDCRVGYSTDMKRHIGEIVVITKAEYSSFHKCYFYKIDRDCGHWWWDDTCLEPLEQILDLPEFDAAKSLDMLFL